MPTTNALLAALALTASGPVSSVLAQHANPVERVDLLAAPAPSVYQDQMVVAVNIETTQQLAAALKLAESSWTERPGLGLITLQIKRDNLAPLTALGLTPILQIADLNAHTQQNWDTLVTRERLDRDNNAGAYRPAESYLRGASSHDESWFTSYKQLADIYSYMDVQIAAHPDLITKADFGDTIESRDLFAFTITAPDETGNLAGDRPVIIWNGAQHAREWVSPMTVTYIASKLLDDSTTDPEVQSLLSSVRFVIIPVLNPDGYLYTWSSERYWRKNRRNNAGSSFDGVDLNRNWDSHFGGAGTSTDPSSDIYHGTAAFSEPETTALSNLALSYGDDLAAHIDYHTFSQLILWPLGYADNVVTPEPDRTKFINLSGDMSALIQSISGMFYNPIQSWQLYPAAGTCSDWFYEGAGVTSFTVELRPSESSSDGFNPPETEILPTAQENWEAAKLFATRTTQAISLSHDPIGIVDADTPTPVSVFVTPGISEVDASSVTLHARVQGAESYSQVEMIDNGSSEFIGHLPDAPCGQSIEYYFSATAQSGVSAIYPINGESNPLAALSQLVSIAFDDDIESDTGWSVGLPSDTATTGVWERADPQSTSAQPEDDHTPGSGTICWITDGEAGTSVGSFDIDGGATTLTSPMMDATEAGDGAELVYWRWYSNDAGASPNEDTMVVEISEDNGSSWSTLELVTENADAWVEKRFLISEITTSAIDQIRIRFTASDLINGSIVEAGVDDLRIVAVGCPGSIADLNGDGELDFLDISEFLSLYTANAPQADFNGDGEWDFLDISAFLAAYSAG